jgi:flagellar biosynthetic protein FliS
MTPFFFSPTATDSRMVNPTASVAPQLDILLLDGAITSLGAAIDAIELGDNVACSDAVILANAIVSQLYLALDKNERPMMAEQLAQIYNFVLRRLPLINVREGAGNARQIRTILEPLRDTWMSVQTSLQSNVAAGSLHAAI